MRYTEFTPYDIVLLLQGLSVTLWLFVASTLCLVALTLHAAMAVFHG